MKTKRNILATATIKNNEKNCIVYLYEMSKTTYFKYCIEYIEYNNVGLPLNGGVQPIEGLDKANKEYNRFCRAYFDALPNARMMGDFE